MPIAEINKEIEIETVGVIASLSRSCDFLLIKPHALTPQPDSAPAPGNMAAPSSHGSASDINEKLDDKLKVKTFNADLDVSDVDERKLLRKLDLALVPWLSFLYLLSFLDRTSIGNAKVPHRLHLIVFLCIG